MRLPSGSWHAANSNPTHPSRVGSRNLVGSPSWFTSKSQHDRNLSSRAEGWTTQNWAQKRSPKYENGTSQIFTIIYIWVCSCCSCCSDHGTIDGSKWIQNQGTCLLGPAAKELHRGMEHHHHEVARRTERLVHRRKIRWFLELKTIVTICFAFVDL